MKMKSEDVLKVNRVNKPNQKPKPEIPLSEKLVWTVREAAAYSNIGEPTIRELAKQPDCTFSFRVGRKINIKRKEFEEWIARTSQI